MIGWKDEKNQQHIYHTAQNGERDKMGRKYAKPVRSRQACMRISFYKMEIKNLRIGDPEENII